MGSSIVKPVETRRERKAFLQLPWALHRGDPNWIPPLRRNQEELVGYRAHPFYDDAEVQTFLAWDGGQACGRIAAIIHHAHNRRHKEQRGFFGFFECVEDEPTAGALFDAARSWLATRGMTAMRGPMSPSFNYEIGLLIDGFQWPPAFMMPYNPRYYEQLVEAYGFHKAQDLYAYWGNRERLNDVERKTFTIEECQRRFGIKLRRMDRTRFRDEIRAFLSLYNEANQRHWGFVPLSDAELEHTSASLKHLIVPELTCFAEIEGRPVGSVFGLLDYNPRVRQIDGRLFPFGFLRLLWNRRAIRSIRILAAHVVPEYQHWGVGLVVVDSLVPDALAWGIQEAEFSWVAESNTLSWKSLERGGAIRRKTYRIYDLEWE